MKLKITHTTKYSYDAPVNYGLQQARLTPVSSTNQTVTNWNIIIDGGASELMFTDQYANLTTLIQADQGTTYVSVTVNGEIETHCSNGVLGEVYDIVPLWHFIQDTPRTSAGKGIQKLAKKLGKANNTLDGLHALSRTIATAVPYGEAATFATTPAEDALKTGGGVCQDHAQIFIAAARYSGIPARYVSGYLMMDDRVNQDASHAWAEAHIDGLGWVGFDVSNGICPDERYVRVAIGRDSRDAAPITGIRLGSASEFMTVSLQIQQ